MLYRSTCCGDRQAAVCHTCIGSLLAGRCFFPDLSVLVCSFRFSLSPWKTPVNQAMTPCQQLVSLCLFRSQLAQFVEAVQRSSDPTTWFCAGRQSNFPCWCFSLVGSLAILHLIAMPYSQFVVHYGVLQANRLHLPVARVYVQMIAEPFGACARLARAMCVVW